ncbi:YdcF family protein [Oceanibium sediminis]|uniref:YdcF family protein n=1 Tax=Oceanibium sediminis TaxID=2026339 RepID=UPI0013009E51|nr:YdcF family protein [Oceanibium sediminis]
MPFLRKCLSIVRFLLVAGIVVYVLLVAGLRIYVETYRQEPIRRPVAALVVLSAGPLDEQRIYRTAIRTEFAAQFHEELLQEGDVPKFVTTGCCDSRGPAMAGMAEELGVSPEHIIVERRSYSTLQNALFAADLLGNLKDSHIVVITDRFHIPRARASFHWAGVGDVVLLAADGEDEPVDWDNLFFEAMKWPPNLIRAAAHSTLSALGWERDQLDRMLK